MHKYSLTLKSRGLEREYHYQQIEICKRQSKPLLLLYLIIGFINLIFLSIDQIKQDDSSSSKNLSTGEFYIVLAFLIFWIISTVSSLVLLYQMPNKFNIFYSFQQFINIVYHMILINFKLNISDSIFSSNNISSNNCSSNSSQSESDKPLIQFHVLEGFLLAIIINRGYLGTKFLVKASLAIISVISLVFISINELERPYIQIPIGFACLAIILAQIYEEDKNKRQDFLVRRKDEEWNKIIKNVLPTNFIIAKYNAKESRIELEQANRKANRQLGITNNDNFQKFTKNTMVQKNEIISNEKDLNRILKGMQQQQPYSVNGVPQSTQQQNPSSTNSKDSTLYSLIRSKIEDEMNNKRKVSLKSQSNNIEAIMDTISEAFQSTIQGGIFGRQKKKSVQSSQIQTVNQSSKLNQKRVHEYIGTYRPNGFDVDKKLLIRVSTFSLNEIFAVITIENETYREKYIKQIKFSTFLEKIFSFQLKKFKESYLIVLNELNRINNQSVLNQLLYHNVKCMNRVNSYLQYFEFKNSSKHEFSVTEFPLTAEIYKILRSLKHYIVGKRIRTYYENTTHFDKISTDEERLQQIFFMILEHLMVNSPQDGYVAIRVTNDQTISNCFKIQIQSTYDSALLNQINLQTFNIDELYNDYEIYSNYFVSLRIAIKLITLMGPYNKIDFHKNDKNILFTSFSIFSDLEVIKTQQIRTQQNNCSLTKIGSIVNMQQHQHLNQQVLHQQPSQMSPLQQDMSQNGAMSGVLGSAKYQNESTSVIKPNNQNRQDSVKNGDNNNSNNNNNNINNQSQNKRHQTTLNNINSAQDLNDSGNVSEIYDEQNSFNQWFKLKQLQHSCLANQKVFDVISTNLPNPASKKLEKKQNEKDSINTQPAIKNKSSGENSNSLNKTNSVVLSETLTEEQKDLSKSNNLINYRKIPPNLNLSRDVGNPTMGSFTGIYGGPQQLGNFPNLAQKQNLKTIILNDDMDANYPINPVLTTNPYSNKSTKSNKKFSLIDKRSQVTNSPNIQLFDSQRQLNSLLLNNTSTQLLNQQQPNSENHKNSISNKNNQNLSKTNSYSSRLNDKEVVISFTKHPNNVYSAGELGNDSELFPLQNNQQQNKPKKRSKF